MSAILTKIGLWLAEKLGLKFLRRLWKKIREQPETKVKLPSGLEVIFKGEEAPGVYINGAIGRFLAMPIRTPSGLPQVVEAKKLMETGESEMAEAKVRELLSEPARAIEAPSEEQAFLAALRLLDEGDTRFHADDFAGAEKAYRKAGEMATSSGNELLQSLCLNALGAAVGSQDKDEEALPLVEEALALNPDFAEAWCNKGAALLGLERYDEAVPALDEAIRLEPGYALAWYDKGTALLGLERYEEAIPCFDEALRLRPDYAVAWCNKGAALLGLERYDEAIPTLDEAIRLKPDFPDAWYDRGTALLGLERYEEAILYFDETLKLKPDYAEAWGNKGTALLGLERDEEAIPCFDETIKLKPDDARGWYNKGTALVVLERYEEALPYFDEALRLNPSDGRAWAIKGMALVGLDQSKEAKKSFGKALPLRDQLLDKGALVFDAWTFLIVIEALESITSSDMEQAKERASELAQLRKQAETDNMAEVVDEEIAEFKGALSKGELKQFRKFEKMLSEVEKS
ncbi:Cell division coordinator CpoB [subsurface metagenome]